MSFSRFIVACLALVCLTGMALAVLWSGIDGAAVPVSLAMILGGAVVFAFLWPRGPRPDDRDNGEDNFPRIFPDPGA